MNHNKISQSSINTGDQGYWTGSLVWNNAGDPFREDEVLTRLEAVFKKLKMDYQKGTTKKLTLEVANVSRSVAGFRYGTPSVSQTGTLVEVNYVAGRTCLGITDSLDIARFLQSALTDVD